MDTQQGRNLFDRAAVAVDELPRVVELSGGEGRAGLESMQQVAGWVGVSRRKQNQRGARFCGLWRAMRWRLGPDGYAVASAGVFL